jgi:hypothetical protein
VSILSFLALTGADVIPTWLHLLSIAMLLLGALCAFYIAADVARRPQKMWIMNLVERNVQAGKITAHGAAVRIRRRDDLFPISRS